MTLYNKDNINKMSDGLLLQLGEKMITVMSSDTIIICQKSQRSYYEMNYGNDFVYNDNIVDYGLECSDDIETDKNENKEGKKIILSTSYRIPTYKISKNNNGWKISNHNNYGWELKGCEICGIIVMNLVKEAIKIPNVGNYMEYDLRWDFIQ